MEIEKDVFDFQIPTKIYYRPNGVSQIGFIIKNDYNFKKVYLIYGGHSLKKYGAYEKIITSLKDNGIDYREYSGIEANPDIEDIRTMVKEVKEYEPDLLLACGGGSVIDAAKSVAHGFYYDGDPLDFNKHLVTPIHALKVATILTIAASGSEMSDSCVVSDRKHHFKAGFNSVTNYPFFSLLDPTLTYTVPPYQTACGVVDMFSHSFERYYSFSHSYEPCDDFALSVMRNVMIASKTVFERPDDYESRRALMILGSLSHNGITNFGKKKKFIVHPAEHVLSGRYPSLIHGQGIALLLPLFLEANKELLKVKILRMGEAVFQIEKGKDAEDSINALKDWLSSLPIYHSFAELPFEIDEDSINKAASMLKIKQK